MSIFLGFRESLSRLSGQVSWQARKATRFTGLWSESKYYATPCGDLECQDAAAICLRAPADPAVRFHD
jgi:hypothetical protein